MPSRIIRTLHVRRLVNRHLGYQPIHLPITGFVSESILLATRVGSTYFQGACDYADSNPGGLFAGTLQCSLVSAFLLSGKCWAIIHFHRHLRDKAPGPLTNVEGTSYELLQQRPCIWSVAWVVCSVRERRSLYSQSDTLIDYPRSVVRGKERRERWNSCPSPGSCWTASLYSQSVHSLCCQT